MRRLLGITLLVMLLPLSLCAQTSQQNILQKLNAAVAKISTLQCDFVQTKHMKMLNDDIVARGIMVYKASDKLRWEYTSPYTYTFILNGTKVYLSKAGRNNVVDIKKNKMFGEIAHIMMNSVVGNCLTDTKNYKVTVAETSTEWVATLVPKKSTLKQMFNKVVVHFSKSNSIIQKVEMHEKNGDNTVIQLKNIRLNKTVGANVFKN